MRITGLATGLDVDTIVKETMVAYRTKIDQQNQKKDIAQIKQQLYRDLLKESKEFYNKHFDILKSDSLFLSSNWKNVNFTSSSPIVKVTGNSEAKAENYKISGSTATSASYTLTATEINSGDKITINGKEFTLEGTSSKNISDFNTALKSAGISVTARYTVFTGNNETGLILESTKLGAGNSFVVGGTKNALSNESNTEKGMDATAKEIKAFTKDIFTIEENVENKEFVFDLSKNVVENEVSELKEESIRVNFKSTDTQEEKLYKINEALSKSENFKGIQAEVVGNEIVLKTKVLGPGAEDFSLTFEGQTKTVDPESGKPSTFTTMNLDNNLQSLNGKISINGSYIDLGSGLNDDEKLTLINSKLDFNSSNVKLAKDETTGNYKLISKVPGSSGVVDLKQINEDTKVSSDGVNASITIEDSKGKVYTHTASTNTFTIDGVTFDFKGKIEANINITGETNTDGLKDGIVKLFNDYNTLIEKLNTLITEKKNKGYAPLTKEQRSELNEKEVELWDEKVKQGQLYKDSDLTKIANSLKQAMRTMVDGTGLTLEQIGISPVADYSGTKNGTFIIDEAKLSKALETNLDNIKNMFIASKPNDGSDSEKYRKTGIFSRVKDILYKETMISSSSLAKKVGLLGTATATDNTISNSIKAYERKIEDMEVAFLRREQLLYNKYAKLESLMNTYNSQQSYLMQSLGMGQ